MFLHPCFLVSHSLWVRIMTIIKKLSNLYQSNMFLSPYLLTLFKTQNVDNCWISNTNWPCTFDGDRAQKWPWRIVITPNEETVYVLNGPCMHYLGCCMKSTANSHHRWRAFENVFYLKPCFTAGCFSSRSFETRLQFEILFTINAYSKSHLASLIHVRGGGGGQGKNQ